MISVRIVEGFLKGRFSVMLISFAVLFLVVPLMPRGWISARASDLISIAVVVSCLRAISASRIFFYTMVGLTVLVVGVDSAVILSKINLDDFQVAVLSLKLIYLMLVFVSIMRYVLNQTPVTLDKVCGALSAYFLMGFTWAVGFTLFYHINPDCFNVPIDDSGESNTWAIYFSFTTLSTLGYGDITPQTIPARAYAIMEAVCGQIFLAVIVARLIALQIAPEKASAE